MAFEVAGIGGAVVVVAEGGEKRVGGCWRGG